MHTLEQLYKIIGTRKDAPPSTSYTAELFLAGRPEIARKVGEEAIETLIEGITNNKEALIAESADLLYHLLVLWSACEVAPEEVWEELQRRHKPD